MSTAIPNVTIIRNTRTGQTGTFRAAWLNEVTGQQVVMVKIGRYSTGWNIAETAVCS